MTALEKLKTIHRHSTFEMFLAPNQELCVTDEVRAQRYENAAVILPPFYNHYAILEENCACLALYFTFEPTTRSTAFSDALRQRLSDAPTAIALDSEGEFYAKRLMTIRNDTKSEKEIESLLTLLFFNLFRRFAPSSKNVIRPTPKIEQYANLLEDYISSHYTGSIHLEDIAKELFLCPKQASRVIRRLYDCTLSQLVNRQRLYSACMLLRHTDLEVNKIAQSVGYEHENYFYTLFHKEYGVTPGEYRASSKNN